MGLLQDKLAKYDLPQQYMAMGVYPYFRTIDSHQDTEVLMDGKKVLMFGSNAYTGLTYDKRIIEAAKAATDKYGTGCAGSRLLNGTLDIHVELEKELAEFVGKDDALCFSTGFTVNEGVIPQLTGRNDYIICDDRVHASIVDGRRLSFSTQLKYKHNDMADLEKELQKCEPDAIKLIVVDSVFSMEGDLANTPAATAAAREALHIIMNEPERQQRLWDITNYALKKFRDAGFEIGETESPIIPLYVRDAEKTFIVTKMAFDEGIFINPVIPPACAPQDTLVRVALMATHTKEQVDYAVEKLTKCFRELGVIE